MILDFLRDRHKLVWKKERGFEMGDSGKRQKALSLKGVYMNFPVNRDEIRERGKKSLPWKEIAGIR